MSSLNIPNTSDESFSKAIAYSIAAHLLLVAFFTVRAVFFAGEPLAYERAVRIDMVALPDKLSPEEIHAAPTTENEKPIPEPPAKKSKPTETAINLEKPVNKAQLAMKKLKAMEALEEIEKEVAAENKKKIARQFKGNQLSSGTELRGLAKIQHENYVATVERHIRENWALPEWLAQKKLKAQVRVFFDERGNIISKYVYRSSGNPSFDEIALTTVEKSSPVPAPPEKFAKILRHEGILFGFPE